jgi:hypothetical protein
MLSDAQWALLEPLVEICRPKGMNRSGFVGGSDS